MPNNKLPQTIPNFYISPVSWGLGDLVVCLPIIQELISRQIPTYGIYSNALQKEAYDSVIGLKGSISHNDINKIDTAAQIINLRNHDLQKNYWWGGTLFKQNYPNYHINDILKIICNDFNLPFAEHKLVKLTHQKLPQYENTLIFIANSFGPFKSWPTEYWLEIHRFLTKHNYNVILLGRINESQQLADLINLGVKHVDTPQLSSAINILSSAKAVVTIDSGLAHISVNQGTPTIIMFGHNDVYYRPYPNSYNISAKHCSILCNEQYDKFSNTNPDKNFATFLPWDCKAEITLKCMSTIMPQSVIDKLSMILKLNNAKV